MTDQEKMKQSVIFWTTLLAQEEQPEQEPVFDCPRCGNCCPQQQAEPVAWMSQAGNFLSPLEFTTADAALYGWTPVYTTPPAPQRKPLTTEERNSIVNDALRGHASTRDAIDWAIRQVDHHHGIGQTP